MGSAEGGFASRPARAEVPVCAYSRRADALWRVTGSVEVPGDQRLSDWLNGQDDFLEVQGCVAELLMRGEVLERTEESRLILNPAQVDVVWSPERRRGGDPALRIEHPKIHVRILTPDLDVVSAVRVPEGARQEVGLPGGRSAFVAVSPATVSSRHINAAEQGPLLELCLVNRATVITVLAALSPLHAPSETCMRKDCSAPATSRCEYSDSTGARCDTAWCSTHASEVDGATYCDRHHSVVLTLGAVAGSLHELRRPALNDRTLSLLQTIFGEMDAPVKALLDRHAGAPGAVVGGDQHVRAQFLEGALTWERGWGVALPQGYLARVLLRVRVGEPPLMQLLLNRRMLFEGIPDFIQKRLAGNPTSPEDRRAFVGHLLRAIQNAELA